MTARPVDAMSEAGPDDRAGPPAVADFTGLAADEAPAAPAATFDDLDKPNGLGGSAAGRERPEHDAADPVLSSTAGAPDPVPVRTASLDDISGSEGSAEDRGEGSPPIRIARVDGRGARSGRSSRPHSDRAERPGADPSPGGRGAGGRGAGGLASGPQDDDARAKEICLRLLTDRARTVQELYQALRRKEIPDDVARRVLERLDEVGLVDDEAFAGQWVRSRHRHRGLGRRAIAAELYRKGVAKEIADEALTEIDAESEEARARELVDRKLRTVPVGTKDQRATAARRLVGMLARKGYGGGVAYGVVREAIAARGAEEDELGPGPFDD